jgi:hypothetical protein
MKTYRKIKTGLGLSVGIAVFFFLFHATSFALYVPPIPPVTSPPQTTVEFWQACAYKVAFSASGGVLDTCDLSPTTNGINNFNYGSSTIATAFTTATYQTSYGPTPPTGIALENSDGQPLVAGQTDQESLAWNNVSYIGQSYTAGNSPDTREVKFYVYQPAAGAPNGTDFALLASINSDGSLQVLALVYDVAKDGKVFAAPINQVAIGSTATGGKCAPDDTSATCGPVSASSGISTSGNACDLKSNGWSLAWFACPALEAADSAATNLMHVFEQQLPFCIIQSGLNCNAQNNGAQNLGSGQGQVRTAWSLIKNIATAILVIVMLVMVISQAIGGGPFDAYTVRKMLPKMVIATILMQISWPLFAWVVDIVNDIGNGLGDLMYAPFGGASNLDFGSLLSHASINSTQGFFIGYLGAFLGVAIGVAYLPTLLFAAFSAALTLLIGLAVLVFRKILIILLLIFSPLALAIWILPGQGPQRLWKMWLDNFTKVLMMFPLIVAIIAAGRIFAYVSGATNNGSFINFWLVIAGYFLPLAILPKAYKWGGTAMSAAGNSLGNMQRSIQSATKQPLKNWAREKTTDKWANNYNPLKKTLGSRRLSSALQSIAGGRVVPTKAAKAKMLFRGQQWSSTMAERNDALRNNFVRKAQEQGMPADMVRKYDRLAREKYGMKELDKDGNDTGRSGLFSAEELDQGMRPNAIGSGKKSSQILAMMATEKNDSELLKSIGRYNVQARSLLEMADKSFVFPQQDPVTKNYKMVPIWDWRPLVDQAFKDPSLWGELGGMRPDLTPNNVPRGGARYQKILAKAGFRRGRDVNGREFDVSKDAIRDNPREERYAEEFTNPDGSLHYKPYLMQKLQALDEDTLGIIQAGKNTLLTFAKEISGWNQGNGYYGEGKSALPAQEFTDFIVKQAGSESGLRSMASLKSTDSHKQAIDNALKASGYTQFKGADGEIHDLTVDNIFGVNERAFAKMHASADYEPAKSELVPPPTGPAAPAGAPAPATTGPASTSTTAPATAAETAATTPSGPPQETPTYAPGEAQPTSLGSVAFNRFSNELAENTVATQRLAREMAARRTGTQPTIGVPTPTGEIRIVHEPVYQPGDTIRPVVGTSSGIVMSPGIRSVEPQPRNEEESPPSEPAPPST